MTEGLQPSFPSQITGACAQALASEVCESLPIAAMEQSALFRYLGYPKSAVPAPRSRERINAIVSEALPLLQPRGAYALYPVADRTARSLTLADITIAGNIGEFLDQTDRVAAFVVTVGEEISCSAKTAARDGDAFTAWVMDALGSWAVEMAADALMLRIGCHLHEQQALTLRYSPGYCGMDLGQQQSLFQLVPAESVGIHLSASMLMRPLKSVSGLVGLAPEETVARYHSPCDLCPRTGCHMRR